MPDIERRGTVDDPFRHKLSHAAGAREAVSAEAGSDPEAAHVGRAQDELSVGRERLGTVDQLDNTHPLECGDAHDGVLHQLLEARPVLLEQLAVEVGRDPVERPRSAVALVAAHDQPARLGPEVDEQRRVAHRRHVEWQTGRFEHEVLVGHRDDRDVDPGERAYLARVHPAGVDHDARLDPALVRLDPRYLAALDRDPGHARVGVDLGASATRTFCEGERQLARVDVPVAREVRSAENTVGRHRRKQGLGLRRRDQLERKAEGLGPAGLSGDLLESLR